MKYGLGWHPSLPSLHYRKWEAPCLMAALPPSADLSGKMPAIYDQSSLGSCVANGVAGACQYDEMKQGILPTILPSRLFIYYGDRSLENSVASDSGSSVADGCKS